MASFCITRPAGSSVEYFTLEQEWTSVFTAMCLFVSAACIEALNSTVQSLRAEGVDAEIAQAPHEFYTSLRVVKVVDYKVPHKLGYQLLNGWGLYDTIMEDLVCMSGSRPYLLSRKKDVQEIVNGGLIGVPKTCSSNQEQRAAIKLK